MPRYIKRYDGKTVDLLKIIADCIDDVNRKFRTDTTIGSVSIEEINITDYHRFSTATQSLTVDSGSDTPVSFAVDVQQIHIQNLSPSASIYVELRDGIAATSSCWEIGPGETEVIDVKKLSTESFSIIASADGTPVKVRALYTPPTP